MMSPETKRLVEQSAVPLISSQIETLRDSLRHLEQTVFKMERDLQSYAKATTALTEELNQALKIRTHRTSYVNERGKQAYFRDPISVAGRWGEWKKLLEEGTPTAVVARQWGVDRRSIQYARKQNFKPALIKNQRRKK
jgi:hypothetical protein